MLEEISIKDHFKNYNDQKFLNTYHPYSQSQVYFALDTKSRNPPQAPESTCGGSYNLKVQNYPYILFYPKFTGLSCKYLANAPRPNPPIPNPKAPFQPPASPPIPDPRSAGAA